MRKGRGDAVREIGGKGKKALGVGVGFSECMHTWGIDICWRVRSKGEYQEKRRSNHIDISEQAITRTEQDHVLQCLPFYRQALTPPHVLC